MMAKTSNPNSVRFGRRIVAIVALTLFLFIDATLLVVAVTTNSPSQSTVEPISPSAISTDASTPIDSVPVPNLGPARRLITAWDADSAWRMTVSDCPAGDALVEHSLDGGKTWDGFDLGATGGIASASVLQVFNDRDSVYLLALSKSDCSPAWVATSDGGDEWAAFPDRSTSVWYVNPADRSVVFPPGGERAAPCQSVVGVAGRSVNAAAVICSDESVWRTEDSGTTWVEAPAISGAVALGNGPDGYLVASSEATCSGAIVSMFGQATGDSMVVSSECVVVDSSSPDIALGGNSSALWLWAGSSVLRSVDGGTTWR
jgi:hypothetical protein